MRGERAPLLGPHHPVLEDEVSSGGPPVREEPAHTAWAQAQVGQEVLGSEKVAAHRSE